MTEDNRRRLLHIKKSVARLVKSEADAQMVALQILLIQEHLHTILTDLILRPEVNS